MSNDTTVDGSALSRFESLVDVARAIARRTAMRFPQHSLVDVDDMENVALVAAWQAVQNYDVSFGATLETYARTRVRGAILDEVRRLDELARSDRNKQKRVEEAEMQLHSILGREPTEAEIARHLGIENPEEFFASILHEPHKVRLDSPMGFNEDHDMCQHDVISDENWHHPTETMDDPQLQREIDRLVEGLPKKEKHVVQLYFWHNVKLADIAFALGGITESRASQILANALLRLRGRLKGSPLVP